MSVAIFALLFNIFRGDVELWISNRAISLRCAIAILRFPWTSSEPNHPAAKGVWQKEFGKK